VRCSSFLGPPLSIRFLERLVNLWEGPKSKAGGVSWVTLAAHLKLSRRVMSLDASATRIKVTNACPLRRLALR